MPIEPPDAPRPGRIILPGQETAAPEGDAPASGSRIIVPAGARGDADETAPEYPRLRPLELMVVREGERDLLLVNDPLGVMPGPVALRVEALPLIQLLDGTVSVTDLAAEIVRGSQDVRSASQVREFVSQLDQLLMLESPRFDDAYEELRRSYHQLEVRQATLSDLSYPADPETLARFLDGHFAEAETRRAAAPAPARATALPRAILAPHLDPRRAGATIAQAMLEIAPASSPVRVTILGTGHLLLGQLFALTRKHFETPLGQVPCDLAFVEAVASRLGRLAYQGELAHRTEHSIEFQALYLKRRLGDRPFTIVPILCGGFGEFLDDQRAPREDPGLEDLIAALRDAARDSATPTVYLAGVDLSHVGPRFGDPRTDERMLREVEDKDRAALAAAARGDADGWFQAIASHEDSTRICGWAPTYVMLRCAEPGEGRLLHYEQSPESDGSMVSIAAMAWP
jgi:hypothetical protein